MRQAAQTSPRLSFFCHGKCDALSSWGASLQRKNSLMPTGWLSSPGEAAECGSRAIFDVSDLEIMGEVAGCARAEPTWSVSQLSPWRGSSQTLASGPFLQL